MSTPFQVNLEAQEAQARKFMVVSGNIFPADLMVAWMLKVREHTAHAALPAMHAHSSNIFPAISWSHGCSICAPHFPTLWLFVSRWYVEVDW